jgi:hypothetical protein
MLDTFPNNAAWQEMLKKAQPNRAFRLNWGSYKPLDYATTFLPDVNRLSGKGISIFDASPLFGNLRTTQNKPFRLQNSNSIIDIFSYIYPQVASASVARKSIHLGDNDLCSFIELEEDGNIEIYYRFGKNFNAVLEKGIEMKLISAKNYESIVTKTNFTDFSNYFKKSIDHYSVMQYILENLGLNNLSGVYKLESSFAMNQLKQTAKELGKLNFSIFILSVFGNDIELEAIHNLYDSLQDNTVKQPNILITKNPVNGRKANYNPKTNEIIIWEYFIDKSLYDEKEKATLLIALVEEYGHHIDYLLRAGYTEQGTNKNDYLDEGAKFAFFFLNNTTLNLQTIKFAKIGTPYFEGLLTVDFDFVKNVGNEIYKKTNFYDENPKEEIKGFGAGFNPGEHGGIELSILTNLFESNEVLNIYYGNWLRDYSQVIVGATIRLTNATKNELSKSQNNHIANLMKKNPLKLSHEGWIKLLEIFAAKEFVFGINNRGKFCHQYADHLEAFREDFGKLTKDLLGIYRPEEHIDNPKELEDESSIPVSFNYEYEYEQFKEKKLYVGEASKSLEIDPRFLLKKFIHIDIIPDRPSSDTFLKQQLKLAAQYGKNKDGFRHLGAALHVIEDYFAHSNFIEIALIKAGMSIPSLSMYKDVYPWVEGMQGKDYQTIPIVTGKFLEDDTFASVLPKLADKLFPIGFNEYEKRKPGDRTFSDGLILTLLTDLSLSEEKDTKFHGFTAAELLEGYKIYLSLVDNKSSLVESLGKFGELLDRLFQKIGEIFDTFTNIAFNLLLQSTDEDTKEAQTLKTNANYGTNPTHTQLAKDATNHPMNGLAASLASYAVLDIATRLNKIWESGIDSKGHELANYVVNTYTKHPKNTTWETTQLIDWANQNKNSIDKFTSATIYEYNEKVLKREINNPIVRKLLSK